MRTSLISPKLYYSTIILIGFILVMGLANAEQQQLGTFKQNTCITLKQTCANCTFVNITSIIKPDSTQAIGQVAMSKTDSEYSYTFCNTTITGTYIYNSLGNPDGILVVQPVSFDITQNGRTDAGSGVIVLFVVFFTLLVGLTCYLAIYTLGHLMSLDFDLRDLAFDWGMFMGIVVAYILEEIYLGNLLINQFFVWFLSIGGIILVLVPIIAFILSITIGNLSKKRLQAMNAPARIKFRRGT